MDWLHLAGQFHEGHEIRGKGIPQWADPKHPRKFSEKLKRQVVEMYDNGKPTSEILEEYDLGSSTFHRWVKAIHASGSTRAADSRTPEEQELIELRKQNKQLRMENGLLKPAALIFARR